MAKAVGKSLVVTGPGGEETHLFGSAKEARARAAFINEAVSWVGTPFQDCADVKGRTGCVDCAMLLVRSVVDTGLVPPFDPRPYSPNWMLHRDEEKFIGWMESLGASEVEEARVGDVIIWQFGRCFCHGAVLINSAEVMHAYSAARMALISRRDEPLLTHWPWGAPRPVRFFDLWG